MAVVESFFYITYFTRYFNFKRIPAGRLSSNVAADESAKGLEAFYMLFRSHISTFVLNISLYLVITLKLYIFPQVAI